MTTPIVPVVVGDDWKAVLLWRALYDAGVYVNVALHPAVPPAGALLRTSVMATHDEATLDRALETFATVKATFESEHGPLPGARAYSRDSPLARDFRPFRNHALLANFQSATALTHDPGRRLVCALGRCVTSPDGREGTIQTKGLEGRSGVVAGRQALSRPCANAWSVRLFNIRCAAAP